MGAIVKRMKAHADHCTAESLTKSSQISSAPAPPLRSDLQVRACSHFPSVRLFTAFSCRWFYILGRRAFPTGFPGSLLPPPRRGLPKSCLRTWLSHQIRNPGFSLRCRWYGLQRRNLKRSIYISAGRSRGCCGFLSFHTCLVISD